MKLQTYFSISALQTAGTCFRKAWYGRNRKQYPPKSRAAALIKGSAVHGAIRDLHKFPEHNPEAAFDLALDYEESTSDVPIDWGKTGRDGHVAMGREIVLHYWRHNGPDGLSPIDVRSSERWFFLELPMPNGEVEHIRGRLDLLIAWPPNLLVIRENKTGMTPEADQLEFDPQCLLQAYAMKNGYLAIGDIQYIGPDDEKYHIHKWEPDPSHPTEPGQPTRHRCTACNLEAEHFGVYPDRVILYHVPSLVPYKNDMKPKKFEPRTSEMIAGFKCPNCGAVDNEAVIDMRCDSCGAKFHVEVKQLKTKTKETWTWTDPNPPPRGNPDFEITFDESNIKFLIGDLQSRIFQVRNCEAVGVWPPTSARGFMSPCRFCEFLQHCEDMRCCSVAHEEKGDEPDG